MSSPVFARYTIHQESESIAEPSQSNTSTSEKGPLLNQLLSPTTPSLTSVVSVGRNPTPQSYFTILFISALINYTVFMISHCLNCLFTTSKMTPMDEGMLQTTHQVMMEMHCCSLPRLAVTLVALIFVACVQAGIVEYYFRCKERARDLESGNAGMIFDSEENQA